MATINKSFENKFYVWPQSVVKLLYNKNGQVSNACDKIIDAYANALIGVALQSHYLWMIDYATQSDEFLFCHLSHRA